MSEYDDEDPGADESRPPARPPWERAMGEPDQAWRLFSSFVMSSASIARFAREEQRELSSTAVAALASRWRWRARRDALTWHLHREAVQGAAEEARALGKTHAQATASALDWAVESIAERRSRGEVLEPREAIAFLKASIELQRLAAGEPTARASIDLSSATNEGLARLRSELERAISGAPVEPEAPENPEN